MSSEPISTSITSFAIHGNGDAQAEHAHLVPIYATSTFTFDNCRQGMDRFSGKTEGYIYSRFGNPTVAAAEDMVAGLEAFGLKTEDGKQLRLTALLHASGQSAMTTLLLSNLSAGDQVLSHPGLYGGTHELIYGLLPRFGIRSVLTSLDDENELEKLLQNTENIKLIHIESPANPTMTCTNIEMVCRVAKRHGVKVSVDNTFATPYLQQPFRYGADFIVHSTTKFLNGHGTSIGGVLVGKDEPFMNEVAYGTFKLTGGNSNPFDAYLLLLGIKTLGLRMEQHCRNAEAVALFLSGHPAVEKVHYNGLATHPSYGTTLAQMKLAGAVLSFELKEGMQAAMDFVDCLRMCTRAVSVGTADTLVSHPASMSHSGLSPEDRRSAGITDGLIRMSVGLEAIEDILTDIEQALRVRKQ